MWFWGRKKLQTANYSAVNERLKKQKNAPAISELIFILYFCGRKKELRMKKMKSLLLRIGRITGLKYAVVAVVAIVLIGFVDENSAWNHLRNKQRISELEEEIAAYTERCHLDQERIRTLDANPKAIEKIARERYFMKADDEDVFVLSDDEQPDLNTTR